MENIISVKNVSKKFDDYSAIRNMTFDVKEGEIFGFLGPSGAGKTTTIKILTSQLMPTSGEATVLSKLVYSNSKDIIKEIGVLTDNSGLYERLTVRDNLVLFAEIYGLPISDVDYCLDRVGLLSVDRKEVKKLSKGMKQRLMLARAILHKPKLLFLDEPTAALDPGTTLSIHTLLRDLNKEGTTIFLTTHNMEEADKLCDRVAFLNEGEIVEIGEPLGIKIKYMNNDIKVYLKDDDKEDKFVIVNNDQLGAACISKWMIEGSMVAIHSLEPSLEDVFLRLTGRVL